MKYCQGTSCHEYRTKDRIRGTKGNKSYQTRRRSSFNYSDNFCSLSCCNDWLKENLERALDHFGRVTEAKRAMCDQAWYKDYRYSYSDNLNGRSTYNHFLVNDLLGQRIPITEQQYNDDDIISPNNLSQ